MKGSPKLTLVMLARTPGLMDCPEGHNIRPDLLLMMARRVVPTDLMALRSQPQLIHLAPGEDGWVQGLT